MEQITYKFLLEAKDLYESADYEEALKVCSEGLLLYPKTLSAYSICIHSILQINGPIAAEEYIETLPDSILENPRYDKFISNLKNDIQTFEDVNKETTPIIEEEDNSLKLDNVLEDEAIPDEENINESLSKEMEQEILKTDSSLNTDVTTIEPLNEPKEERPTSKDENYSPIVDNRIEEEISPHNIEELLYLTSSPDDTGTDEHEIELYDQIPKELEFSEDTEEIAIDHSVIAGIENEIYDFTEESITPSPDLQSSTQPPEPEEEEVDMLEKVFSEHEGIEPSIEYKAFSKETAPCLNPENTNPDQDDLTHLFGITPEATEDEGLITNEIGSAQELVIPEIKTNDDFEQIKLPEVNDSINTEPTKQVTVIDGDDLLPPILEPINVFDNIPIPQTEDDSQTELIDITVDNDEESIDIASLDLYSESVRHNIITKGMQYHRLRLIPGFEQYQELDWEIK